MYKYTKIIKIIIEGPSDTETNLWLMLLENNTTTTTNNNNNNNNNSNSNSNNNTKLTKRPFVIQLNHTAKSA